MIRSFLEQIPKGLRKEILDIRCYTKFRGVEWSMTAEVSARVIRNGAELRIMLVVSEVFDIPYYIYNYIKNLGERNLYSLLFLWSGAEEKVL